MKRSGHGAGGGTSTRKDKAAVVAVAALLSAAILPGFAATNADAASPAADKDPGCAGCWILPAGDLSGNRFVQQKEITVGNVAGLKPAWRFTIPDDSLIEAAPIEADGTVYITSAHDDVYALDAKTGKLQWQYSPHPKQLLGFPWNRGVALLNGKVYIAMVDGHILALDAKTGKKVWDKLTVQAPEHEWYSMQPVPYKNVLLVGVATGEWAGIGNISAFNPENGDRIWSWDTIPKLGEPGNESWSGDSWKRGGAATWSGVAIDPSTNTLYLDLGNPQPDFIGEIREGANLYSDSMVALDISGAKPRLKWYHQFISHDTHDWDVSMPPVLFTAKIGGTEKKLVAASDKSGSFDVMDAETGARLFRTPVNYQYNLDVPPSLEGTVACPSWGGGVEFNGGAFDPTTNTFFLPSSDQCMMFKRTKTAKYVVGQLYLGGPLPKPLGPGSGWFNAIDLNTGVFAWRHYFNLPANGGALVLSDGTNSVVFTGELNGNFDAFDAKTGKLLWDYETGASVVAPPATYVEGGKRYVVVAAGNPGVMGAPVVMNVPGLRMPGPAVLWAFSLE